MSNPDDLNKMTDDQLIEHLFQQFSSNWDPGKALAERNRELAKAVLGKRYAEATQRQNKVMIRLTWVIGFLTLVMAVLTAVLVYRAVVS